MTEEPRRRRVGQAPTIYDVAREAGVAPSTVSRAFSRPGRVKAETAERDPGGGRPPRLPDQPAGAGPVDRPQLDGRAGHPGCDQPRLLRHHPRGRGRRRRGRLHPAAGRLPGVGPAGARGDRPGGARGGGARPGGSANSDSAIRMAAKQRPTVVLNRAVTDLPSVVTDNPRASGGPPSISGRWVTTGHHLPGRAGGVVGRRDAVAVPAGGGPGARAPGAPPRPLPAHPCRWLGRGRRRAPAARPPRSSPTTT